MTVVNETKTIQIPKEVNVRSCVCDCCGIKREVPEQVFSDIMIDGWMLIKYNRVLYDFCTVCASALDDALELVKDKHAEVHDMGLRNGES